jgi:hypothetical protein
VLDLPATDRSPASCSADCGQFGNAVQGPGDVDGDGVADQLVDAPNAAGGQGRMYLFSGRTGELLHSIDTPEGDPRGGLFGFQDVAPLAPGDVNGDGHPDLYAANFDKDGPTGPFEGRAWVFDGQSCATPAGSCRVLYELKDPTPQEAGNFGWSMDKTDYNSDGIPDLYIGQAPHHGGTGEGGTAVFNGKDGSLLKVLDVPVADRDPNDTNAKLGYFVIAPGDLNADGHPDFVAGAEGKDIGGGRQGALYSFLSQPQCSDGQDNDADGKTDFPADPGCGSFTDDSESPDPGPAPGLVTGVTLNLTGTPTSTGHGSASATRPARSCRLVLHKVMIRVRYRDRHGRWHTRTKLVPHLHRQRYRYHDHRGRYHTGYRRVKHTIRSCR